MEAISPRPEIAAYISAKGLEVPDEANIAVRLDLRGFEGGIVLFENMFSGEVEDLALVLEVLLERPESRVPCRAFWCSFPCLLDDCCR